MWYYIRNETDVSLGLSLNGEMRTRRGRERQESKVIDAQVVRGHKSAADRRPARPVRYLCCDHPGIQHYACQKTLCSK
jgi:hypothetical protein